MKMMSLLVQCVSLTSHSRLGRLALQAICAIVLVLMCLVKPSPCSGETVKTKVQHEHWHFTDAGRGRTGGHNSRYISFHNYESNDGILVQRSVESYKSDHGARIRLKNLTARASKVIERGTKKKA